jgi:stearoyl-CoA desaturase (delta-9 desaturase)
LDESKGLTGSPLIVNPLSRFKLRIAGTSINWDTLTFMIIFHAGALGALFMFSWKAVAVTAALWWVSHSLGVGVGFHRLLTHRGFKTPKAIEYFLTLCGALSLESGPISWVATHRMHHAHTDREGDPHSPRDGGWWSHIGWILVGTAQQHPPPALRLYAPDLIKDRFHVWLDRWYYLPLSILGFGLFAADGWGVMLWGVCLRVVVGWHFTWLVNSATHMWGTRRFKTRDDSTNSWWVALLTFGEGWHNNHHAHPAAARHGLRWYEIDVNWYGIRALQLVGLAKSVKLVKPSFVLVQRE